jgi:thioesterase domain-containing protein
LLRYGYPYLHAKIENRFRRLKRKRSNREIAKANSTSSLIADVDQLRSLFGQRAASYEVKPYAGRITLFMLSQRNAMSDSLYDPALGIISPSLGWESVAARGVERYELSGGHVDILKEPFVRALGERLRQCLDREQLASAGCT